MMLSGKRPNNLGVRNGRFAPCRLTPNCVSSQADPAADPGHHADPIAVQLGAGASWSALMEVLRELPRVTIIQNRPGYVYAECRSRIFGFVDDLELHLDKRAGVIHVRSASRLGRRDFGVNRRRVETIRSRLARRLSAS
ncbi:MAG: hypothetical protein A3G27_04005 [Betaproteobacteria bacterium RIFCSPLOWO2_12_FULL_66_14]|nr:MAG: hypothetical protein A3G27_04005 [Betaproteobacteria bacterium RIFCSPLOWO2_12_FULL_66_14]